MAEVARKLGYTWEEYRQWPEGDRWEIIDGEEGPTIAVWEGRNLDGCHRHHSRLASISPFDSLGEWTPEKEEIIDNSIDHWIAMGMGRWSEWCIPWAAIIQSRLGFKESPRILLEMWREVVRLQRASF